MGRKPQNHANIPFSLRLAATPPASWRPPLPYPRVNARFAAMAASAFI